MFDYIFSFIYLVYVVKQLIFIGNVFYINT